MINGLYKYTVYMLRDVELELFRYALSMNRVCIVDHLINCKYSRTDATNEVARNGFSF
jgi:hypothetical protein